MSPRAWLLLLLFSTAALIALIILSNNLTWGLQTRDSAGSYFLFHRNVPEPWGRWLWFALIPALLIALLGAVLSLYNFITHLRHARRPGYCHTCGYDLRATPRDGLCPECGTPRRNAP